MGQGVITKNFRIKNSDLGVHAAKEPQAIPQGVPGDIRQTAQLFVMCLLPAFIVGQSATK